MGATGIFVAFLFGAIAGLTIVILGGRYPAAPFRPLGDSKPRFDLMPKYKARYCGTLLDIRKSLESHGFRQSESEANTFQRGSSYGDFSLKWMKLIAEVEPVEQQIKLSAERLIVFDTGDLWQLLSDIVSKKPN